MVARTRLARARDWPGHLYPWSLLNPAQLVPPSRAMLTAPQR
jgi:hypothetical protein